MVDQLDRRAEGELGGAVGVAAAVATSLMVPVLPVVGIAAGIGLVLEGLGVSWRRRGIGRREQALGEAAPRLVKSCGKRSGNWPTCSRPIWTAFAGGYWPITWRSRSVRLGSSPVR